MLFISEIAPVYNPALDIAIGTVLACLVAFGVCVLVKYFLIAFFNVVERTAGAVFGWFPGVNAWVHSKIEHAENKAVGAMSHAVATTQGAMANAFHAGANQAASMGHEIYGLAVAVKHVAEYIRGQVRPHLVHAQIGHLQGQVKAIPGLDRAFSALAHRQQAEIRSTGAKTLPAAITIKLKPVATTLNHVGALELPGIRARVGEQGHAIPRDYPSTRDLARGAERHVEVAWKYLLTHPWAIPTTAFAGAVAISLGRLGGGWIRCSNWNKVGRSVCRMPTHLLDDLLGLVADFVVLANICQVLPWLEAGASAVATPLIGILSRAGAGLCVGSAGPAPTLPVPSLYLPPAQGAPTLHLP